MARPYPLPNGVGSVSDLAGSWGGLLGALWQPPYGLVSDRSAIHQPHLMTANATLFCINLLGLSGTGKTRTALSLASLLMARGEAAVVLHTDLWKVTLRPDFPELRGPAYAGSVGEIRARAKIVHPYLVAQADKANKDGYWLIVEGTLGLSLGLPQAVPIVLTLPESIRRHRVRQKPASARDRLVKSSLTNYRACLDALSVAQARCFDCTGRVESLSEAIYRYVMTTDHTGPHSYDRIS